MRERWSMVRGLPISTPGSGSVAASLPLLPWRSLPKGPHFTVFATAVVAFVTVCVRVCAWAWVCV